MKSPKIKDLRNKAIEMQKYFETEKWREDGLTAFSFSNVTQT